VTPLHLSISFLVCPWMPFLSCLGSYPKTGYGIFNDLPRVAHPEGDGAAEDLTLLVELSTITPH
jgi:hypothetical protein